MGSKVENEDEAIWGTRLSVADLDVLARAFAVLNILRQEVG